MTLNAEKLGVMICERLGIDPDATSEVEVDIHAESREWSQSRTPGVVQVTVTRYWPGTDAEKYLGEYTMHRGKMKLRISHSTHIEQKESPAEVPKSEVLSPDTLRLAQLVLTMYPDAPMPPLLEALRKEERARRKGSRDTNLNPPPLPPKTWAIE